MAFLGWLKAFGNGFGHPNFLFGGSSTTPKPASHTPYIFIYLFFNAFF
jgi:hypothetical protein